MTERYDSLRAPVKELARARRRTDELFDLVPESLFFERPIAERHRLAFSTLFEAITQLPEYGLWRAEHRLLEAHAGQMTVLAPAATVIELGSGSATKREHWVDADGQFASSLYVAV